MPSSAIAEGKEKRSEAVEVKVGLLELPSILSINTRFQGLEMEFNLAWLGLACINGLIIPTT